MAKTDMREVLHKQLDVFYASIFHDQEHSLTIRKWCITIWVAVLAAIATGKLHVDITKALFLAIVPVVMFWILDAFKHSFIDINWTRVMELEVLAAGSSPMDDMTTELFFASGRTKTPYKQKIWSFLKALFTKETVIIFYLLLFLGSLFFIGVFGLPKDNTEQTENATAVIRKELISIKSTEEEIQTGESVIEGIPEEPPKEDY